MRLNCETHYNPIIVLKHPYVYTLSEDKLHDYVYINTIWCILFNTVLCKFNTNKCTLMGTFKKNLHPCVYI